MESSVGRKQVRGAETDGLGAREMEWKKESGGVPEEERLMMRNRGRGGDAGEAEVGER